MGVYVLSMYVCVYIKLSHFVVDQKLIQHSNSALLA